MPFDLGGGRRVGPTRVSRPPSRSARAYQRTIRPSNVSVAPQAERRYTRAVNYLSHPLNIGAGLPSGARAVLPDVLDAAARYNLDPALLLGQEQVESGFNPENYDQRNYAGAGGISQFIPSTGAQYGVRLGRDRASVRTQIMGQAHYMSDLGARSNPTEALNRYWGVGGSAPTSYSRSVFADAQNFKGVAQAAGKRARAQAIVSRMGGRTPGGGTGGGGMLTQELQGKLAADRAGWEGFSGGPRQVRTAIDVIPSQKLNRWIIANGHDIEHLNPVLARHLIRLAKASGEPIQATSAYRSVEDQAAIDPGVNPKAPPGLSAHQFGMALDANFTPEQTQLAPRFGLEHGQASPTTPDTPHTELTDPRLIRKALRFGPIRSGFAPAGVPLSEGDLGKWSSAGTASGVASGAIGSTGGGISAGTGSSSARAPQDQQPVAAAPLYSPQNRTGIAAAPTSAQGVSDIENALAALLGGQAPTDPASQSVLAQILSRSRRYRPRR